MKVHFLQDPLKAYIFYQNLFLYVLRKKPWNKHLLATHDYYFMFKTFFSPMNNKDFILFLVIHPLQPSKHPFSCPLCFFSFYFHSPLLTLFLCLCLISFLMFPCASVWENTHASASSSTFPIAILNGTSSLRSTKTTISLLTRKFWKPIQKQSAVKQNLT